MGSKEVMALKSELEFRDTIIRKLEAKIIEKDELVCQLESQLDKYRSIIREQNTLTTRHTRIRGTGISAEPTKSDNKGEPGATDAQHVALESIPKTKESADLIRSGILRNDFLRHLGLERVNEMVRCMHLEEYNKDDVIIQEGAPGYTLYVIEEGSCEVSRNSKHLSVLQPGTVFGELAILYNCQRTATIKSSSKTKLWCINRLAFQSIMMRSGIQKQTEYTEFLRSVPTFQKLSEEKISKLADCIEERIYSKGDVIVRQGERGDTFYVIKSGTVSVWMLKDNQSSETFVRNLQRGDFFGERALQGDDLRTATVKCESQTECLIIDKEAFSTLISSLDDVKTRYTVADQHRKKLEEKYAAIKLDGLRRITTLGIGGFGRVDLVVSKSNKNQSFALKKMKKSQIIATRQQEHIRSEREIMCESQCPFICQLYKTFKDTSNVYLLLEVCLGGELWTILRDKGQFDESTTRFYVSCVLEAFNYLHSRNIIYRDLKPENMLLDADGYVKLVDFGFAKKLDKSKTWTFCGTPEYVAPEIILNKGHDTLADYWSLGVLFFELMTGMPPFDGTDPMSTYNKILRGIDSIQFPSTMSKEAINVIKRLCRDVPTERLTYTGLAKHKWFEGFDWHGLRNKSLPAPIIPNITSPTDASNFDLYPDEEESEGGEDVEKENMVDDKWDDVF